MLADLRRELAALSFKFEQKEQDCNKLIFESELLQNENENLKEKLSEFENSQFDKI